MNGRAKLRAIIEKRMRRMGLFQDVPAQAEAARKEGK